MIDALSLLPEYDHSKIDSRHRLVIATSQRAKHLMQGARPAQPSKYSKATSIALEEMLNQVAEFHEDELDRSLTRITTWVEPVLLLVMGGLVAVVVITMYLPIFNLAGTIK